MRVPKHKWDYPCWADFEKRYCDSFALGHGCRERHICKAYQLQRSADLEDNPTYKPYYPEVPQETGVEPEETEMSENQDDKAGEIKFSKVPEETMVSESTKKKEDMYSDPSQEFDSMRLSPEDL